MDKLLGMLILIGFILGVPSTSYADKAIVPGSIKAQEFEQIMKENGMDLSCTDDADGCIENKGTKLEVISYEPLEPYQLNLIMETAAITRRD